MLVIIGLFALVGLGILMAIGAIPILGGFCGWCQSAIAWAWLLIPLSIFAIVYGASKRPILSGIVALVIAVFAGVVSL